MAPIKIQYFSDVLCVWAYVSQRRIDELVENFGDQLLIESRYCSVFPDAWGKIESNWKEKGGFGGFNQHIREVASRFPHVSIHDRLWLDTRPRTSASAHIFLKAIELVEREAHGQEVDPIPYSDQLSTRAAWELREAFFGLARDISDWQVQSDVAEKLGIDCEQVDRKMRSSEAMAQFAVDYSLAQKQGIEGSPTYVVNNGRQKLFGNVGYRLLEANVVELLRSPPEGEASWC